MTAPDPARRTVGVLAAVAGLGIALASLGFGYTCLFARDRILVLQPDWAEPAAIGRLAAEPGAYDGRRVRVRGELWRIAPAGAVLVPAGSGPEQVPVEALTAFYRDPANRGKQPPTVRPLPASRLAAVCGAGGTMKTLSFYDAADGVEGGEVEVAGRFARAGGAGGTPVLLAAAVVHPPQPEFKPPVQIVAGLAVVGPLVGAAFVWLGFRLGFTKRHE